MENEVITKSFPFCLPQYIYPQLNETIRKAIVKADVLLQYDELFELFNSILKTKTEKEIEDINKKR